MRPAIGEAGEENELAPVVHVTLEHEVVPIRIKQAAMNCLSPWQLCRPRRTLVSHRVQWLHHTRVATDSLVPIPWWLALRAIRMLLQTGDGDVASHSFELTVTPVRFPGLPATVVTHAKQRVTSNGLRSFRM
jgi:hypothetical protein